MDIYKQITVVLTLSDTLFLSKLTSFLRNPWSASRCLDVLQSGVFFNSTQTAPITCLTSSGGLAYTRISEMSDLSRESRAEVASCSAGSTEAKSLCACWKNNQKTGLSYLLSTIYRVYLKHQLSQSISFSHRLIFHFFFQKTAASLVIFINNLERVLEVTTNQLLL